MPTLPNTPPFTLSMSKTRHQGSGSRTDIGIWRAGVHVPFPGIRKEPHEVPVPGPIPGTVIPVCESGIRSSWQNKLVLRPGISPIPPFPASVIGVQIGGCGLYNSR